MRFLTRSATEEARTPVSARKLMGKMSDDVIPTSEPLTRVVIEVDGDVLTVNKGLLQHTASHLSDPAAVIRQLCAVIAALEGMAAAALKPSRKPKAAREPSPDSEEGSDEEEDEEEDLENLDEAATMKTTPVRQVLPPSQQRVKTPLPAKPVAATPRVVPIAPPVYRSPMKMDDAELQRQLMLAFASPPPASLLAASRRTMGPEEIEALLTPEAPKNCPVPDDTASVTAMTEAVGALAVSKKPPMNATEQDPELFDEQTPVKAKPAKGKGKPQNEEESDSEETSSSEESSSDDEDDDSCSSGTFQAKRRRPAPKASRPTAGGKPLPLGPEKPMPIPENPSRCTVIQLKDILRSRGLLLTGTKPVLLERLLASLPAIPADE